MQTKEWRTIDKSTWARGPWDDEPDKVQWSDPETGLPCLAVRQLELGHWCGYVGIEPGHSAYGRDYETIDVVVHGSLTFSGFCSEGDVSQSICHVPDTGESDHLYWLGFDCHHFDDLGPGIEAEFRRIKARMPEIEVCYLRWHGTYRRLDYVRQQCAELARQLASIK